MKPIRCDLLVGGSRMPALEQRKSPGAAFGFFARPGLLRCARNTPATRSLSLSPSLAASIFSRWMMSGGRSNVIFILTSVAG